MPGLIQRGPSSHATFEIDGISDRLRTLLADDPPRRAFDELADHWLNAFLTQADRVEPQLLPRRMQRALDQMRLMTLRWATDADRLGSSTDADRCRALSRFASTDDEPCPPWSQTETLATAQLPGRSGIRRRRPVTWWASGSWEGPPLGGAIGVILGVFLQEHTKKNFTDGPVTVWRV